MFSVKDIYSWFQIEYVLVAENLEKYWQSLKQWKPILSLVFCLHFKAWLPNKNLNTMKSWVRSNPLGCNHIFCKFSAILLSNNRTANSPRVTPSRCYRSTSDMASKNIPVWWSKVSSILKSLLTNHRCRSVILGDQLYWIFYIFNKCVEAPISPLKITDMLYERGNEAAVKMKCYSGNNVSLLEFESPYNEMVAA